MLSLTLTDVVSFTLADIAPALIYVNADDYKDGVTYSPALGGTVSATGNFSVSVRSSTETLTPLVGTDAIAVGSIALQANGDGLGTTNAVNLSTTAQDIISGADSGLLKTFGLTYSTTGEDSEFLGKAGGVYSTTLVFSCTLD